VTNNVPDSDTSSIEKDHELSIQSELLRKGLHLIALLIPLGMVTLDRIVAVAITGILALACIALELSRAYSSSVNATVIAVLGPVMRAPEEQTSLAQVEFSGATHILISAALLSLLLPVKIGAPLLAMFVVSDGVAAVVGRNYGQLQFPCNEKTVEGFFTFSLVGAAMLVVTTDFPILLSALMSLLSSALESAPISINDNLYVPVTSSFILFAILRLS
jgi:dolichol kinase